ncbi:MAG: hypothetical protein WBW33_32020 [Bryobacteraceae bacterium]
MAIGHKTGGRTVGTPNRKTREVAELLESLGCDPIEGMVRIAMDQANSPELRGKMYSDLSRYVYPQRKAIEHSGVGVAPLTITVKREDIP